MSLMLETHTGLESYFTLHKGKVDADGVPISGTRRQVAHFKNLITNNGLDKVFSAPGAAFGIQYIPLRCYVGSGNAVPAFTDGTMNILVAESGNAEGGTTAYVAAVGPSTMAHYRHYKTWRYGAGLATGNLTEVGTGWATNNLFSRALILDEFGNPTTITVLADEYLDVTFEHRNWFDTADKAGTMQVNGVTYNVAYRPFAVATLPQVGRTYSSPSGSLFIATYETNVLVPITSGVSGGSSAPDSQAWLPYTNGTYFVDLTCEFGLNKANFGTGIGMFTLITRALSMQMALTPKIPKTSSEILQMNFRNTWGRYTP